jgi:hypothetical protein
VVVVSVVVVGVVVVSVVVIGVVVVSVVVVGVVVDVIAVVATAKSKNIFHMRIHTWLITCFLVMSKS